MSRIRVFTCDWCNRDTEYTDDPLERVIDIAQHLLNMIPTQVWRDQGGDDGQGHYEGEYHAEKIAEELRTMKEALHEAR